MADPRNTTGTWVPGRDETFFRIVQPLFPAGMLLATGVLLASYDEPTAAGPAPAPTPRLPRQRETVAR